MATYIEIQAWVMQHYGFTPKTCWIAHVKSLSGIKVRQAPNRLGAGRVAPCPNDKIPAIRAALVYFKMIKS